MTSPSTEPELRFSTEVESPGRMPRDRLDVAVVGGPALRQEAGADLMAELERILGAEVAAVDADDVARLGPSAVVFITASHPQWPLMLDDLNRALEGARSSGVERFATVTTGSAAAPATGTGAVQAAAERLTAAAGRTAVRAEVHDSGALSTKGLEAPLRVALGGNGEGRSGLGASGRGRVLTGPAQRDDGTIDAALWGEDEVFSPGPVAGVWTTIPPRLAWDRLEPIVAEGVEAGGVSAASDSTVTSSSSSSSSPPTRPGPGGLIELLVAPSPAPAMSVLLSSPVVAGRERELVLATLDSGWLAPAGPQLDTFEAGLSRWVDDQPVVALSSGTAALHLALVVSGVERGDEVVVQSATFAASAFAVGHAGAVPVFCDVDQATGNLDPDLLDHHLSRRASRGRLPAAVVAVDLYGCCADYRRLRQVCDRYEVPLIQDSAESLGSRSDGVAAGAHGDLGILSFNGNKIITTSGGGALTGPRELIDRARKLATQAREPGLHYEHHELGYNYRLSGLLASVGTAQLETLPDRLEAKAALHQRYVTELPDLAWFPSGVTERWNHWLSVARLPDHVPPHLVCRHLAAVGIECRPCWKPMHRQPVFHRAEAWLTGEADDWFAHGICLPSGYGMEADTQDRVVTHLRRVVDELS